MARWGGGVLPSALLKTTNRCVQGRLAGMCNINIASTPSTYTNLLLSPTKTSRALPFPLLPYPPFPDPPRPTSPPCPGQAGLSYPNVMLSASLSLSLLSLPPPPTPFLRDLPSASSPGEAEGRLQLPLPPQIERQPPRPQKQRRRSFPPHPLAPSPRRERSGGRPRRGPARKGKAGPGCRRRGERSGTACEKKRRKKENRIREQIGMGKGVVTGNGNRIDLGFAKPSE